MQTTARYPQALCASTRGAGASYAHFSGRPLRESPFVARSPQGCYQTRLRETLTLSIEQLEYLEMLNAAIVDALEQSSGSDAGVRRALVLAKLARSQAQYWHALFQEDQERA
ncbi:hypothetical protein K8B33_00720 [Alcanivorax sp. JB21]|uniref:hypothetical protein n=1 Tax=Alcanivorax limicola TaxID=2874102 RepID=UPI001CBDF60F|nr:hypothetical protein [Alcanivorax limicola]MBZ2187607.1 hypothetical protein [Alcanivorax limicola]